MIEVAFKNFRLFLIFNCCLNSSFPHFNYFFFNYRKMWNVFWKNRSLVFWSFSNKKIPKILEEKSKRTLCSHLSIPNKDILAIKMNKFGIPWKSPWKPNHSFKLVFPELLDRMEKMTHFSSRDTSVPSSYFSLFASKSPKTANIIINKKRKIFLS